MKIFHASVVRVTVVGKSPGLRSDPAQITIERKRPGPSEATVHPSEAMVKHISIACMGDTRGTIRPLTSGRIGWVWEVNDE